MEGKIFTLKYVYTLKTLYLAIENGVSKEDKEIIIEFKEAVSHYKYIRDFEVTCTKEGDTFYMREDEDVVTDGYSKKFDVDVLIDMFIVLSDEAYFSKSDL